MNRKAVVDDLLRRSPAAVARLWGYDSATGRGAWTTGAGWFKSDGSRFDGVDKLDRMAVEGQDKWTVVPEE